MFESEDLSGRNGDEAEKDLTEQDTAQLSGEERGQEGNQGGRGMGEEEGSFTRRVL